MKTINKSSYLKVFGQHFLSKTKKKKNTVQKNFIFCKIAVGKTQLPTLIKKTPSQVPLTGKLAKKIVKFCHISQSTEAVT